MVNIVYYEVYILSQGDWQLHGRYPSDRQDDAIREGKEVEYRMQVPIKIIRETYNPKTNFTNEVVVYLSDKIRTYNSSSRKKSPSSSSFYDAVRARSFDDSNVSNADNKPPMGTAGKFAIIVAGSLFMALIVAATIFMVVKNFGSSNTPPDSSMLMSVFITVFLFCAIPLTAAFIPWSEIEAYLEDGTKVVGAQQKNSSIKSDEDEDETDAEGKPKKKKTKGMTANIVESLFSLFGFSKESTDEKMSEMAASAGEEDAISHTEKTNSNQSNKGQILETSDLDDKNFKLINPEDISESDDVSKWLDLDDIPAPVDEIKTTKAQLSSEEKEAKNNKKEQSSKKYNLKTETAKRLLMEFLSGAIEQLKTKQSRIDTQGKFALNILLAGASETIASERDLDEESRKEILVDAIQVIGTKKDVAKIFTSKLEAYLLEPKYMSLYQEGSRSMDKILKNDPSPFKNTVASFENWSSEKEPSTHDAETNSIVTVMFTDIVNSTLSTQELGDDKAQNIVRTHNNIVRSALNKLGGKEIKHTGDGIMSSFTSPSSAVEAAIKIQHDIITHNLSRPNEILEIRIGLNAGEPIVEDDDLFGTTVQIASRICSVASSGQILVASVVKELSAGKGFEFNSLGPVSLKGIKEAQNIYEVKL